MATTFERCARSLGGFRGDATFRGYVLGIARNVLADDLRRRCGTSGLECVTLVDLTPAPSVVVGCRVEMRILLRALRSLPLPLQMVLELHFFEHTTRREAAEILQLPPGTVASRLRKAKQQLAAKVQMLATTPSEATSTLSNIATWAAQLRARMGRARLRGFDVHGRSWSRPPSTELRLSRCNDRPATSVRKTGRFHIGRRF